MRTDDFRRIRISRGPQQYALRTTQLAAILVVVLVPLFPSGTQAAPVPIFRVIINASNPSRLLTRTEINRLFLKKADWPSHLAVLPVDLPEDSRIRRSFSTSILERQVNSITSYWQYMMFSGRATPPVSVKTEEEAVAYVRLHREAIGYVSTSTSLEEGVVEVSIVEERR
jgi:hypothetical protein